MLPSGTRLCTKDGRVYGNGIVIGYAMIHDEDIISYQIETDFGNVMFKRADDIDQFWWIADDHPDEISLERWMDARNDLRLRSSMVERRSVEPVDTGSVPVATATLAHPDGCLMQGRNKVQGQCDAVACNYPFCER